MALFKDKIDAGRQLAEKLNSFTGRPDMIVLGLPRDGVPVAREAAERLEAPLDIILTRILDVPGHVDVPLGLIASGGVKVLNLDALRDLGISEPSLENLVSRQRGEMQALEQYYRGGRPYPELRGQTVILVDDGLGDRQRLSAAAAALRELDPERIIAAVPAGTDALCTAVTKRVDELICVYPGQETEDPKNWYADISETTDEDVREILSSYSK